MKSSSSKVYVVKTDFTTIVKKMLELLRFISLPNRADKIAIKINLCDYRLRETGAVSDPIVVDALLNSLRVIYPSSDIIIVENDASSTLADDLFLYVGIAEIANKHGVKCINLAHEKWITKKIDGYYFKKIKIPKILDEVDLLITHPKLKTSSLTKITCGLKNMFGCIRTKRKHIYHKNIDEVIVDINLALKPDCSIVDAILCHEGTWGPAYGFPKKVGFLIGGNDIVAVDAFCSKIAGFNPFFIGHIRKASRKGLGRMSFEVSGDLDIINRKNYKFDFSRTLYYTFKILRKIGVVSI
ncbi:MAG: DUF362 domain-containing protein [Promethearchaeota archaeon]